MHVALTDRRVQLVAAEVRRNAGACFVVLTAVKCGLWYFGFVTLHPWVSGSQHFEGTYCFHSQGSSGLSVQN